MKASLSTGADCCGGVEDVPPTGEVRPSYSARRTVPAAPIETEKRLSELGVIPCDWRIRPLREVAQVQSGITKNSKRQVRNAVDVHYLRVANVQDGYLDLDQMSSIRVNRDELVRYAVLPGDVLMNEGGDLDQLGRGAMWRGEFDPCVHQNHVFVVRCRSGLVPEFLNVWTASTRARRYFLLAGKQTTNLASINKTALGELPVLMPRLEEQRAIAEALSDVDGLLGALDALIAKKRAIKQAAMQQLLTGKTRLPGFSGAWETKRLGNAGQCLRGVSYNGDSDLSAYDTAATKRLLRANNVQGASVVTHEVQYVNSERVSSKQVLADGDILVCMANGSKELVGKAGRFASTDDHEYTFGAFMGCFRTTNHEVDSAFVFYLFQTPCYRGQVNDLLAGSSINNLKPSSIESLEFLFPELDEQREIVAVLLAMDSEIGALEHRRDKTHAIKQGMMQQLLTGRVRLVQPVAATTETATP